jgi:outer membrane receptor protein involved in Fe transport
VAIFSIHRREPPIKIELLPTYQLAPKTWHGRHQIRFGEDVLYRTYNGSSISHPIDVLAQNGLLAEQINFQGAGLLAANDAEAAEFVEDSWNLDSHLTLNFGARLSSQTVGRDAAFAPRAGFAYSPGSSGKTIIRASIGEVYSHVPLLAANFTANQQRVLSFYNPCSCALAGQTVTLQNAYLLSGSAGPQVPGTSPLT